MLFSFFVFSNFFGQLKFGGYFVIAIKFAEVQNSKKHRARSHFRPHHTDSRHKFRFVRGTNIVLGSSKHMLCLPSASIRLFECPNRGFQFLRCFFSKKRGSRCFFPNRISRFLTSSARRDSHRKNRVPSSQGGIKREGADLALRPPEKNSHMPPNQHRTTSAISLIYITMQPLNHTHTAEELQQLPQ